jgi:hypothetical protein
MNGVLRGRVDRLTRLPEVIRGLGLELNVPVLAVVGGAVGLGGRDGEVVAAVLDEIVVPVLRQAGGAAVSGGTDIGVMGALGRARAAARAPFPLVGVAAEGTVDIGNGVERRLTALEPNHTHFVLVPGEVWGAESPWLFDVAVAIAGGRPVVTLVFNGGAITLDDVQRSLERGIPVMVLAGTGRAADRIAAPDVQDVRIRQIFDSPLTYVAVAEDRAEVTRCLVRLLSR